MLTYSLVLSSDKRRLPKKKKKSSNKLQIKGVLFILKKKQKNKRCTITDIGSSLKRYNYALKQEELRYSKFQKVYAFIIRHWIKKW